MGQSVDNFGCFSGSIRTAHGGYFDIVNPDPGAVEIRSIAAALSKICRFGGHTIAFYSVAEHCVLASNMALRDGVGLDASLAILLHDAAEAYIGDMVRPLKRIVPQYREIELRIESAIQAAFRVDFAKHHEAIQKYDRIMLKAEKHSMWPDDKTEWEGFQEVETRNVVLLYQEPLQAEHLFLTAAASLGLEF